MSLPIRRQIIENRVAAAATIAIAGGYQIDVKGVYEHHESPLNMLDQPAIRFVDRGDQSVRHAGFHYANRLQIELWCCNKGWDKAVRSDATSQLYADLLKCMEVDRTCGGLAEDLIFQSGDHRQSDATNPDDICVAVMEITYRTQRDNPYLMWEE